MFLYRSASFAYSSGAHLPTFFPMAGILLLCSQ
jgi:hypothetical protein